MPTREELFKAAELLHGYLARRHLSSGLLRGPDAGVRFNLRAWRFAKSALDFIPWRDDYVFMQTQGYWVLANWMLHEASGQSRYRELALDATRATLELQAPEGYWRYPLPERRHLIATVEGDWGAIALLASYARERRQEFLDGAIRWYEFLVKRIGFQSHASGKAVNYFDRPRGKIPNNSVEAAWFFTRLAKAAGDERYQEHVDGLLDFVATVQLPSGELPYIVESPFERGRVHYLCYQYNAFEFLKLAWTDMLRPSARVKRMLADLTCFLSGGVAPFGACAENCSGPGAEVDYYTAVLVAALHEARQRYLIAAGKLISRGQARLLAHQRPDGGFAYSRGDYGFLRDTRSYPRPLAMTLFHLLYPFCGNGFETAVKR